MFHERKQVGYAGHNYSVPQRQPPFLQDIDLNLPPEAVRPIETTKSTELNLPPEAVRPIETTKSTETITLARQRILNACGN